MGLRSDIEEIEIDVSPPSFENEDSNHSESGSTTGTRRSARFEYFQFTKLRKLLIFDVLNPFLGNPNQKKTPLPTQDSTSDSFRKKRIVF